MKNLSFYTKEPRIYNSDLADINNGKAKLSGDNCVLISINDPCCEAKPKQHFRAVHCFEFLDIEDSEHDFAISDEQAKKIALILQVCYEQGIDVCCNCHAGICRSGAVTEVGEMLGFEYVGTYKQPNVMVKKKLMKQFGWTYEDQE